MIRLRYPYTDDDRLILLDGCAAQIMRDRADSRPYIPDSLGNIIQAHILIYRPAVIRAMNTRGNRAVGVDGKITAVSELERYVRDYWNVLERRIVRENLPRGMFVQYNLLRSGGNPGGRALTDWLIYANDIIKGEAYAIERGYAPMSNPSATEVADKRAVVVAERANVIIANTALDEARNTLEAARAKADKLIRFVIAQLDIALYGVDADDVRRIKMRYGFKFDGGETAVVEEGERGGDGEEMAVSPPSPPLLPKA